MLVGMVGASGCLARGLRIAAQGIACYCPSASIFVSEYSRNRLPVLVIWKVRGSNRLENLLNPLLCPLSLKLYQFQRCTSRHLSAA